MYKVCPKCEMIAEYNAYYGRFTCTRCAWEYSDIRTNLARACKEVRQIKDDLVPRITWDEFIKQLKVETSDNSDV